MNKNLTDEEKKIIKEKQLKYYRDNKEKIKEQNLDYYYNNKDKIKKRTDVYFKEYYRRNHFQMLQRAHTYREPNTTQKYVNRNVIQNIDNKVKERTNIIVNLN
jgi:hypothetical protein